MPKPIPEACVKPKIVKTPEEFARLSDEYAEECKELERPLTITGLALYMGFASKQSIYDYQKAAGFEFVASRARLMVEHGYELALHSASPTGAIFGLKNFGWSDKQELAVSGNLSHKEEGDAVLLALKNKHKEV